MYIWNIKTSQEIKALLHSFSVDVQNDLLGELLIEQALQGKVPLEAQKIVVKQHDKKILFTLQ